MANGGRRRFSPQLESNMKEEAEAGADQPHALQLTAWDVPSAIGAGGHFRAAVGARCSAGCDLGGRELILFDHEGAPAATVKLGHEIWPGTEALYFAEVEARAPLAAGSHQWEAKIAGWDAELPHAAGSIPLIVRVVTAPECEITVRAIDREKQTPIKGARVVIHPYRAVTDDNGIARVSVARGQYDILVSGSQYLPASTSVEVTADMITSAELDADQPWSSTDEAPE
jgi:hypothetical protein